ncbi:MAG: PD40 domain-containing protein [Chloroflexi bacterium]|nr:PD40 domain-containing protein [Chloroflexota bacterium]
MRSASRWFRQVVIVAAVLGLLTSAGPSVAQNEQQLDLQAISGLKNRIRLDDLPPILDKTDGCIVSPSQSGPTEGEMDWTIAVYQTICNGSWDINLIDRAWIDPNWRLTADQYHDIEPHLNRNATRVVFSRALQKEWNVFEWHIFTINIDGTGLTRLTWDSNHHRGPVWSPDGNRIAFAYQQDLDWEIYVMNADGTNSTPLTADLVDDTQPAWSPDGSQIAWIKSGTTNAIWIMNADGSNQHPVATNLAYAQHLRWSPDGTRLALDYDSDGDTMNELAIINTDSTALHTIFDLHDSTGEMWLSGWSPDGQMLTFARIYYFNSGGQIYLAYGSVGRVTINGVGPYSFYVSCANSYNVDWEPLERERPVSRVEPLSAWSPEIFTVTWTGSDVGPSGIASYDIQVKDGAADDWTDWQPQTTAISAAYTGIAGHTYYFRSRAHDHSFNVEVYPNGNGDTSTTVYQYSLTGQVLGNREQPVTVASITTDSSSTNTGRSRHDGLFDLYFASSDTYTLTTTRNAFGVLPPLFNVAVPASSTLPTLYLPPLDDQLNDGHFESGTLSAWNPTGDLTATITTTAHTGNYAVLLGGIVPSDTISSEPYLSTIEQTITVPLTLTGGTLSLLYQVTAADPLSDTLTAYLVGPADTLTLTLPITATNWTHQWFDVSTWTAPTVTLRIELAMPDTDRAVGTLIDEITWGSFVVGSHPIYLPVIRR